MLNVDIAITSGDESIGQNSLDENSDKILDRIIEAKVFVILTGRANGKVSFVSAWF